MIGTMVALTSACDVVTLPWYALKVRTRSEFVATAALMQRGFKPFCPNYSDVRHYCDRRKIITNAIFPGYVFCQFDLREKLSILSSLAVNYIVGMGGVPMPVPESELSSIMRTVEAGGRPISYLRVGQAVRVEVGPLAGLEGLLVRDVGKNRLVVSVHLLQRSVAVHIEKDKVRAL